MPSAELTRIWLALLNLLRYPSAAIQVDALRAMVALVQQGLGAVSKAGAWSATVKIDLEQLTGVLYVLCLKMALSEGGIATQADGFSNERSAWLLRCLGPVSGQQSCKSFAEWCQWMRISASFDILETDFSGAPVQSKQLGVLRVHVKELLGEIGRRAAPEQCNFAALCRVAGGLLARSLAGDEDMSGSTESWVAECDSAILLVESAATATLKSAEKEKSKEFLTSVVQSMQAFLEQVCVETTASNPAVEHRRLEFLSACSGFYSHWSEELLRKVLARVVTHIREGRRLDALKKGIKLEQRALDTLVAISKSKLVEALMLAVAACEDLERPRKVTASWHANELVQAASPQALLEVVAHAATAVGPPGASWSEESQAAGLGKLRDVGTLAGRNWKCTGGWHRDRLGSGDLSAAASALPSLCALEIAVKGSTDVFAAGSDNPMLRVLVLVPCRTEIDAMTGRNLSPEEEEDLAKHFSGREGWCDVGHLGNERN
eukprot:Skav232431  [mRNA]  locus=scaffold189:175619:179321:- [translate_table: standard]